MMYTVNDLIVVGGGPGGTSTAIAFLRSNSSGKVVLLEAGNYSKPRFGETLLPGTLGFLYQLGIQEQFLEENHRPTHGSRSVWGSYEPGEFDYFLSPYGHGYHLDRRRFDRMLMDKAESLGAELRLNTRAVSVTRENNIWEVDALQEGEPKTFRGRFLVDATGRSARIARKIGSYRTALDQLIGVAAYMSPSREKQRDSFTLVEAVEDGWWYSAVLPDGRLVVMFMTDAKIARSGGYTNSEKWTKLFLNTKLTQGRWDGNEGENELSVLSASTGLQRQFFGDGWLAVGDAACSCDPLSSQGIPKAMRSGILAADAIEKWLAGRKNAFEEYRSEAEKEFAVYLVLRRKNYLMENRWVNSPFWAARC